MENTRTILPKVTSGSSYSRHSVAKWYVPRLIYPTELELHRYIEKICREKQTLVRGNDIYTFSTNFQRNQRRGIFQNRIIFFQNIYFKFMYYSIRFFFKLVNSLFEFLKIGESNDYSQSHCYNFPGNEWRIIFILNPLYPFEKNIFKLFRSFSIFSNEFAFPNSFRWR